MMNKKAMLYFAGAIAEAVLFVISISAGDDRGAFLAAVAAVCFALTAILEVKIDE